MLGTLVGLIVLVFALVLRFDPEARGPAANDVGFFAVKGAVFRFF